MNKAVSGNNGISVRRSKLPTFWEFSILILIFYAFFFQYGVVSINNAMIILNAVCILTGAVHMMSDARVRIKNTFYSYALVFVILSVLTGLVFGVSSRVVFDTGLRMIEYSLTGLSVYLFAVSHKDRYSHIVFYAWISVVLLAFAVLFKNTVVDYSGAIGIGSLNNNELSSFFILMVFCSFYLIDRADKRYKRVLIALAMALCFITEIRTASRRGFVVMVFMIVATEIFAVIPRSSGKNSRRRLAAYSVLLVIGAVLFIIFRNYLLTSTILGERLSGSMIGGDAARIRYRQFALAQFKKYPVFGVGIGGINYLLGVYSHSLYYEVLSCTGIVGSAVMLATLIQMVKAPVKKLFGRERRSLDPDALYIYKTIFIYVVSIIASGVAVVMIYDFNFYFSLGLIAAGMKVFENRDGVKLPEGDA